MTGSVSILIQNFAKEQLQKWVKAKYEIYVLSGSKGNRQRLEQLLKEAEISEKEIFLSEESLSCSFLCEKSKRIILSENELLVAV